MKDLAVDTPTLPALVLGSATEFGSNDRLLVKVNYVTQAMNKLPALLIPKHKPSYHFTCFKRVGDTVKEITLPKAILEELHSGFSSSFLYGRDSFSVCLFDTQPSTQD